MENWKGLLYPHDREQKENCEEKKSQRGTLWQRKKQKKLHYLWHGHNVNSQHQSGSRGFAEREFKLRYLLIRENSACAMGLQEPAQHMVPPCKGRRWEGINAGIVLDQLLRETYKGCWVFMRSGEGAAAGRKRNGKPLDQCPWDPGVLLTAYILRVTFSLQRKAAWGQSWNCIVEAKGINCHWPLVLSTLSEFPTFIHRFYTLIKILLHLAKSDVIEGETETFMALAGWPLLKRTEPKDMCCRFKCARVSNFSPFPIPGTQFLLNPGNVV